MRRIFVHPESFNVSGAGGGNYPKFDVRSLQNGGDSSSFVNSIMTQTGSNLGEGIGGAIGGKKGKQVGAMIGELASTVINAVLSKGASGIDQEDNKELTTSNANVEKIVSETIRITQAGENQTNAINSETNSVVTNSTSIIQEDGTVLQQTAEDANKTLEDVQDTTEDAQAVIEKNNQEIQQKQARQQELLGIINRLKGQSNTGRAHHTNSAHHTPPAFDKGDSGNQGMSFGMPQFTPGGAEEDGFTPMEFSGNMELDAAINEFNQLGVEIQTLTLANEAQMETYTNQQDVANESIQIATETSDEKLADIDTQAELIMSTCTNAKQAIQEISNLLKGQFPNINKATAIEIAGMMTKQAVCISESGVLATAAAAMGASSIVSFGATGKEAAELATASVNKGQISVKAAALAVAEKVKDQAIKTAQSQVLATINNAANLPDEIQNYANTCLSAITVDPKFLSNDGATGTNPIDINRLRDQA